MTRSEKRGLVLLAVGTLLAVLMRVDAAIAWILGWTLAVAMVCVGAVMAVGLAGVKAGANEDWQ